MTFKLLTEYHLEFLSVKGGFTDSSESTFVKCNIVSNHMLWLNSNFMSGQGKFDEFISPDEGLFERNM